MKRVLLIDCQLLQSAALHRGMGKYTISMLKEYLELNLPFDDVVIILSSMHSKTEDEQFLENILSGFKIERLPLRKTDPSRPEGYGEIVESNRQLLDKYVERNFSGCSISFLITSMFHEDGCSAFPSTAVDKYLLVYDLIPLQFSNYYLVDAKGRYQYLSRYKEFFNATHYFTISKTVANDLSLQLGISPDKITSIDGSYVSRKKLKYVRPKNIAQNEEFILLPSGDDARKNNLRAVTAFQDFNSKIGYRYKLVITSFFGEKSKSELSMQSDHLVFTGNIHEEELAWLYSHTALILFPSEYEGLGMPLLEAVEFGKPVLCSSIDVFKEIGEKAFHFCDPYSIDDISTQLQKILINNIPAINHIEYRTILSKYSWRTTAKSTLKTYQKDGKKPIQALAKKSKIAVFTPSPAGYSAIGKVVQEQHYELSQLADVDYFIEEGITEKAKTSNLRVNYLPYVANCKNPWTLDEHEIEKYDKVIYHIGNSEYHIATIIKALAIPGEIVLHDTRLKEVFSLIKDLGYLSNDRLHQEYALQQAICLKKNIKHSNSAFIATLVNASLRVIVHSEYAQEAVEQMRIESKPAVVAKLNLPTPSPFEVYDITPAEKYTVGYAGILHAAKGLDLIGQIMKVKYPKQLNLKLFGFSLLDDKTKADLSRLQNVEVITRPSDMRFMHELESCDVIIGYRSDYHGETSLSTLEALRLGRPLIVNNIGWFKEIPEGLVYKVPSADNIGTQIAKLMVSKDDRNLVDARVDYVRKYHSVARYVRELAEGHGSDLD